MDKFLTEEFDKPVNKKLIEYMFESIELGENITPKVIHQFIRSNTRTKDIYYDDVNGEISVEYYSNDVDGDRRHRIDGAASIFYYDKGIKREERYLKDLKFWTDKDGPYLIMYYKSGNVHIKYYKIKDSDGSKVIRRTITYFENGEIEKVEEK